VPRSAWIIVVLAALPSVAVAQPARYGDLTAQPTANIPLAVDPQKVSRDWQKADFYCLSSELSPAILYFNRGSQITFFHKLSAWGLGGPTYLAVPGKQGQALLKPGQQCAGDQMQQAWLLAWFAGAQGWTDWDVPCLLVLQHRPSTVSLNDQGLVLTFPKECGYVAAMPLYGYYKPPQHDLLAGPSSAGSEGPPSKNIRTWEWAQGLPGEVAARCKWYASTLREYPVYCHETFSVDRSKDSLTLRQKFDWISIADDWNTPHRKFGPLSPALALASLDGSFPMKVSGELHDPHLFTPYGPYLGVEGQDSYDITFPVLKYVHEAEVQQPANTQAYPIVAEALQWIRDRLTSRYQDPTLRFLWDHGDQGNFCWQIMGDRWYPTALYYLDERSRANGKQLLRYYFSEFVLKEERFKPHRGFLLLEGPGIGSWGTWGDAGKFSSNMLETLWCYAHYTDDWDLIKQRWPLIKRLFITPFEITWKSFGREAIAEMGDEAAPPLCLARMAYKVGDADTYAFACYIFVRELVHHYIKQRGARYFRENQPYDSMELMPEEVYLTNLWGDTAAWRLDGPEYPKQTGERQYTNRWVRFSCPDVGRFYRDYLLEDVRKELDLLQQRNTTYPRGRDTAHIAPSIERLRSLLLNETPDRLAQVARPGERQLGRDADGTAYWMSFIRTSTPIKYERLIGPGKPTPFVIGIERYATGSWPGLVQFPMTTDQPSPAWPVPSWWGWKPPQNASGLPAADRWSFGQVTPSLDQPPHTATSVTLNWNAQVVYFE